MPSEPPYSGLTPDTVLDALASVGFAGDGRLLALNSYENRVYQVWLEGEETPNPPASVVTKFYRPARWTDAQILDEHAFTLELALACAARCYERAGEVRTLRLHGDCHAGNMLWTDEGPHFVDFDDCRSGPAIQDLWMLLSGDRASMTRQLADVLAGYEDFHDFDPRELHLLEALRTLRLIHYSAWLARRWDDPAFPAAFPWFNTQRYSQGRGPGPKGPN